MNSQTDRLRRLARAYGEMVKALEERLGHVERKTAALERSRSEIDQLAAKAGNATPASLPSMLRTLAAMDGQLAGSNVEADCIRRELITARSRQKMMSSRVDALTAADRRKLLEAETLETVSALHAKASGKRGVVR